MDDEQLLSIIRPWIIKTARKMARRYPRPYPAFEDYKSIGYLAAFRAAQKFEPPHGASPSEIRYLWFSYATKRISGAMLDEIREHSKHTASEQGYAITATTTINPDDYSAELKEKDLTAILRKVLSPREFELAYAILIKKTPRDKIAGSMGKTKSRVSQLWIDIKNKLAHNPQITDFINE